MGAQPTRARVRFSSMPPITKLKYPRAFEPTKRGQHWYLETDGQELKLSNLTKTFYPETGYTKSDLLASHYNLAPYILPYLHDRPLTSRRMPDSARETKPFDKPAT